MTSQFWHKKIDDSDIEETKNAFKEAFKYPVLVSGKIDDKNNLVESKWSYFDTSDLDGKKYFVRSTTLDSNSVSSR